MNDTRATVHTLAFRFDLYSLEVEALSLAMLDVIYSPVGMTSLSPETKSKIIANLTKLLDRLDDPEVWNKVMAPGAAPQNLSLTTVGVTKDGTEVPIDIDVEALKGPELMPLVDVMDELLRH